MGRAVNYCVVTERLVGNVTLTFRRLHFDSSDETNSVKAMVYGGGCLVVQIALK